MLGVEQGFLVAAVVVTAIAAVYDWRTGHIPNWLTFGALGVAPVGHALRGYLAYGVEGIVSGLGYSLLGALICGAIPVLLYSLSHDGAISGGDVKLLAALGAMCLVDVGIEVQFSAFVAVAILAMAGFAYQGRLLPVLGNTVALVANPFRKHERRREPSSEVLTSMRFAPPALVGVVVGVALNWGSVTW
jgi:prepilin peptidase CpaA